MINATIITRIDLSSRIQNMSRNETLFSCNGGSILVGDKVLQGVTYGLQGMRCTNHREYYGECGNQNWNWWTLAQRVYQYEQSATAWFSDAVPPNGGLLDALRQKLAEEDLADMVPSRYCGIRTLHALESLEPT